MKYKPKFIICLIFLLIFEKINTAPSIDINDLKQINSFINSKEMVEVLNDLEFTKYFYFQNLSDISKLERNMPNYNFTECLNKIKDSNKNINDLSEIYVIIIELDDQKYGSGQLNLFTKPINTTIFKFFTSNFRYEGFLDYSICNNMEIKVSKRVATSKMDYQNIKFIEEKYHISVFKNETNFTDYCSPLSINNVDYTEYDRHMFLLKNVKPCDNGCTFINFDYSTNYSTCSCKIHDEDKDINLLKEINERIKDNEWIEKLNQLLNKGNWKYFKCYNQAFKTNKNEKYNWIRYISPALIFIVLILHIFFYISVKSLFDENKSKREETKDKNLKISNNLNNTYTISIRSENEKSVESRITSTDFNKTFNTIESTIIYLSDEKDNESEDIKKENSNTNNILTCRTETNNSDDKDNNNEENINNSNKTFTKKIKYRKFEDNNDITKRNIFSSRNEIHPNKKRNNSNKKKNDKVDGIANDKDKTNNKNLIKACPKIIYFLTSINMEQDLPSILNEFIIYILLIHNLFFYNAFLYSDKTISTSYNLKNKNKNEIKYLLIKEYDRIFLVFLICKVINKIFIFLFGISKESLKLKKEIENEMKYKNEKEIIIVKNPKVNKNENIAEIRIINSKENNQKIIDSLIKCYRLKIMIIHFIIILIQILYLYFFLIFGNVNPNIQFSLLWSSLTLFAIYTIFNLIFNAIKTNIIEYLVKENNYLLACLYKIINEI